MLHTSIPDSGAVSITRQVSSQQLRTHVARLAETFAALARGGLNDGRQ